jgi:putative FmdB family regulatory protein
MPTYQYVCQKCNHQFDLYQSIRDDALTVCPEQMCGQKAWGKGRITRLIGAGAGLIFKGSGFYITDYRSKEYKEAARKDAPASPSVKSEGQPASSAQESKPAKTETPAKKSEAKSS